MAKEDEDDVPVIEEAEEQQQEDVDAANKDEAQDEGDVVIEELSDKPSATAESLYEGPKGEDIKEIMYTAAEAEEDRGWRTDA
ncbi:hypothetical protein HPP92_016744 [Vanilla planifolia]|uniref:Uncharacterized protein n=1 Tax=Vanilla planifolia TaxID=51239 RepID=A0A835QIP9_VANPL|nr:hypothetical protein HPP92_016744 [Vanilla planifolia]